MSKFIKIKNEVGDGHRLLRVSSIIDVEDAERGTFVTYNRGDAVNALKTASTAAEVLEAIQGRAQSCPTHLVFHRRAECVDANPSIAVDWRQGTTTGESALSPMSLDEYKKLFEHGNAAAFPGLDYLIKNCICADFAGDRDDCPTHGVATAWRDLHGG